MKQKITYINMEDSSDYLVVQENQLVDTSCGSIDNSFGEFVGIQRVKDTYYMVMREKNSLYLYSVNVEFPFIFKKK